MKNAINNRLAILISFVALALLTACQPLEPLPAGREYASEPSASTQTSSVGGRLLVKGVDGNVYMMNPDGRQVQAVTTDASRTVQYTQPTWSPSADRMAMTRAVSRDDTTTHSLIVNSLDAMEPIELPAPFPPFYYSWSPSGSQLAYLSAWTALNRSSMALFLVDLSASESEITRLAEGQPFYFSWSPDGERLLTHAQNERIDLLDSSGVRQPLERTTASFPAPAWFPSGTNLLYAVGDESRQRLIVADTEGVETAEITTYDSNITFTLSPDERQIAYAVTPVSAGTAAFAPLFVVEIDTGITRQLSDMPVIAFFWSPDAQKLAFLEVEQEAEEFRFRWRVWDGTDTKDFASILPTRTFLERYLAFFDQYAQSMSLWSPDSSAFTYAAFGQPAGVGEDDVISGEADGIWVQSLDSERPQYVGPGSYAAWSPK